MFFFVILAILVFRRRTVLIVRRLQCCCCICTFTSFFVVCGHWVFTACCGLVFSILACCCFLVICIVITSCCRRVFNAFALCGCFTAPLLVARWLLSLGTTACCGFVFTMLACCCFPVLCIVTRVAAVSPSSCLPATAGSVFRMKLTVTLLEPGGLIRFRSFIQLTVASFRHRFRHPTRDVALGVLSSRCWNHELRHDTSVVTSHVYHVVCFRICAASYVSPVHQDVVQLLLNNSGCSVYDLFFGVFLHIVLSATNLCKISHCMIQSLPLFDSFRACCPTLFALFQGLDQARH